MTNNEITAESSKALQAENNQLLDSFELDMLENFPVVDMPVIHKFTPGLYIREIFMPAGTMLTSKIHKTEHPYVVLEGSAVVYIPGQDVEYLDAGHNGITKANTRRALYIEEDCRWVTFHPLSEKEEEAREAGNEADIIVEMIMERIIEKRYLPGSEGITINDVYKALMKEPNEEGSVCLG